MTETRRLRQAWMRHDRGTLRDYLVQDEEDPRINVQSILTRYFLIRRLFGDRFEYLMEHIVRPVRSYHWNCLSVSRTKSVFEQYASRMRLIHIDEFLKSNFNCSDIHNKGAYTFIITL